MYPIVDKRGRCLGDESIITAKKYNGILVTFPCYEHLLVPDSEIDIFDQRGRTSAALRGKILMGRTEEGDYIDWHYLIFYEDRHFTVLGPGAHSGRTCRRFQKQLAYFARNLCVIFGRL